MAKTTTTKATEKTRKPSKRLSKTPTANVDAKVYNLEGKEVSTVSLPSNIFGLNWNADLVHQVVTSMQSSARQPVAHTKTRGEVRGGGKKPWKQKGTGRARHGSTRSPIWVGGGVAHGPRNDKDYDRKINRKMKAKALFTILSEKNRDGEMLFIESFNLSTPKTKDAKVTLAKLGNISGFEMLPKRRNNSALIVLPTVDDNTRRGLQNMGNLEIVEARNINPVTLMKFKYVVFGSPEEAIKTLSSKLN